MKIIEPIGMRVFNSLWAVITGPMVLVCKILEKDWKELGVLSFPVVKV